MHMGRYGRVGPGAHEAADDVAGVVELLEQGADGGLGDAAAEGVVAAPRAALLVLVRCVVKHPLPVKVHQVQPRRVQQERL